MKLQSSEIIVKPDPWESPQWVTGFWDWFLGITEEEMPPEFEVTKEPFHEKK